jgi:hypothetical protein
VKRIYDPGGRFRLLASVSSAALFCMDPILLYIIIMKEQQYNQLYWNARNKWLHEGIQYHPTIILENIFKHSGGTRNICLGVKTKQTIILICNEDFTKTYTQN